MPRDNQDHPVWDQSFMTGMRRKIALSILAVLMVGLAILARTMSHDSACEPAPALAPGTASMKAIVRRCYGPPDVLALETVEKPVITDSQVLVRVRAASLNPLDWHYLRGKPYLIRLDSGFGAPTNPRLGVDFAGVVESVGRGVTRYRPGDEVFGGKFGALAEFIAIPEDGQMVRKPPNLSFEQAAAVNVAAITALQALRDGAGLKRGQTVLINGASGGVGTFAVQIAKSMGAEVTGVCSTHNVELVRSLGADHVIDYTKEDFTRGGRQYDVVMDNVANRGLLDVRRVLKPEGKFILIGGGGPDAGPWIGPFVTPIKALVMSWFVDQDLAMFLSHMSREDLATLAGMMQSGVVTPVIDRRYSQTEAADAMRYLEAGHARGKVIVNLD